MGSKWQPNRPSIRGRQLASPFDAPVHRANTIAAIVDELGRTSRGDAARALAGTGLSISQLADHSLRISYRQLDAVIQNTLQVTSDETIALKAGSSLCVSSYGMYGFAMLSSRNLSEVLELTNRYIQTGSPCCAARLQTTGSIVSCALEPLYWFNVSSRAYRFAVEFALAAHFKVIQNLLDDAFRFSRISLKFTLPRPRPDYRAYFSCPIEFNQAENLYEFDARFLDQPMRLPDDRSNAMLRALCQEELTIIESFKRMSGAARTLIRVNLERTPKLPDLANELGVHPRTLRRQLANEGTTFRDLCAEVRIEEAKRYLQTSLMTNDEIASKLGFSDTANFRNRFRRLTGVTPSAFRKKSSDLNK